jgi:hypothetical protein
MSKITADLASITLTPTSLPQATKPPKKVKPLVHTDEMQDLQRLLGLISSNNGKLNSVDCVIASCDVENWTREHHPFTEGGITTLDTRDLEGLPADATLERILEVVKHYHFRLRESAFYCNDAKYLEKNG